eukprot:TRINITY_DN7286_c4_g1_i1.p1 TRINITY_DN7286_c4_g1~~TRINITY_DN7286_c4_g1_i1.p1  ORF type:complete len:1361 (+),score=348.89 TRINITY_DN7286_c4_g1_i1:101-4183(+)
MAVWRLLIVALYGVAVLGTTPPGPSGPATIPSNLDSCIALEDTHMKDFLSECFMEGCKDTSRGAETNLCLSRSHITDPKHSKYVNLEECEKKRCICAFGESSYNCVNKTCTTDCNDCTCYGAIAADHDPKKGKALNCEAEFQVCIAHVIKAALNTTFNITIDDVCNPVEKCVEEATTHHGCLHRYADASLTTCAEAICETAHEVNHLIKNSGHAHATPYNIFVLAVTMALGNLCRYFSDTFPLSHLPYTVQVFMLGAAWGALCKGVGGGMLKYGELGDIDPHLLFFIFLPILIFESAFATDYHVFTKVRVHCIFLAGPGLIICSFLSACVAKTLFTEYSWNWVTTLLFGCMLSATDPVAVVALLKELGAAPAISQLIEGESLLNDGTAIVFFNIFKGSIVGGEVKEGIGTIILVLIKVAGGGCVVGWLVGVVTKNCIKVVFNDPEIEITMTLVAAYFTFFVTEVYLGVSGVLGLVVMGMYLAYHSHVISPEVEHSLHHFWEIIVYMGNTLIFAIAGIVITEKALDDLHGYDFLYLLINYIALNIIRGAAMAMLIMPMNLCGQYQMDWKNAVLCVYGGLRGAVGLALALIIAGDADIKHEHPMLGSRFLFHVAGIVVLTLCVNGVTTGFVVGKLGLDKISHSRRKEMSRAYRDLMKATDDNMYEQRRKHVFRDANWSQVNTFSKRDFADPFNGNDPEPPEMEVLQDACEHYYRAFASAVEHEYEAGTMLPSSLRALLEMLADVEAKAEDGYYTMIDADPLNDHFVLRTIDNVPMMGGIRSRWTHAFDAGIGFLNAHERVQNSVDGVCHKAQATNKIKDHCKTVRRKAIEILENHSSQRPEIAMALKSRNASRDLLNKSRGFVGSQIHSGKITSTDGAILKSMIEKNMKGLKQMDNSLMPEEPEEMLLTMCPWYTPVTSGFLRGSYEIRSFLPSDNLLGKEVDGMACFVILSGVVRVHIGSKAENFGPGYTAGLLSILTGKPGKYSEVFAETRVQAAKFNSSMIRLQCTNHRELIELMWDDCCKTTSRKILTTQPTYKHWDHVKFKNFAANGKRYPVSPSEAYPTPVPSDSVAILISGTWKDILQGRETGTGPCVVPPHFTSAIFSENSVLFAIKTSMTPQEKARKHWSKISNKIFTVRAIACLQGHQAGLKAVREVLEGRMTSLFPKGGGDVEKVKEDPPMVQQTPSMMSTVPPPSMMPAVAPPMPASQQPLAPPHGSTYAASNLSSPVTHSPMKPPSQYSFPPASNNGRSSAQRPSRQRNSARFPNGVEMSDYTTRPRPSSRQDPPTESTPWFSQTATKGHLVNKVRTHSNRSPISDRDVEGLSTPLLRAASPGSRQNSEPPYMPANVRALSQDELSRSF